MEESTLGSSIHDPWTYIAVVAVGLVCFFIRAQVKRLEYLEKALRARDDQVLAALAVLPELAEVLRKFHAAARTPDRDGGS